MFLLKNFCKGVLILVNKINKQVKENIYLFDIHTYLRTDRPGLPSATAVNPECFHYCIVNFDRIELVNIFFKIISSLVVDKVAKRQVNQPKNLHLDRY